MSRPVSPYPWPLWLLFLSLTACADRELRFRSPTSTPTDLALLTAPLGSFLGRDVKDGQVNYPALEADPEPLRRYLTSLKAVDPASLPDDEARLAFWINTYNAAILSRVLEGLDASSLLGRARLFKSVAVTVGGEALSPDEIEHTILRKRFEEPLIHFGLVCASKSCPPLRSEAYRAGDVRAQLEDNLRTFLADPSKNRHEPASRTLSLSPIFNWFEEDFLAALERDGVAESERSVARFLKPYAPPEWRATLDSPELEIEFLDYDWTLNGPAPKSHD